MKKRAHHLILIVLLASIASCESPPSSSADGVAVAASTSASTPEADAVRKKLANTENGLEVRRVTIANKPDRIVKALCKHAEGRPIDTASTLRFKQNGFRFLRIPADQIESLIADFGGASYDANEWHGQVHEWRSLAEKAIDGAGRAIAIDGLVRRYDHGTFRLMARAWTVAMEDGLFLHLEMVPRRGVPQLDNLRKLLSEDPLHGSATGGQPYSSMSLDLQLQAGFAYVLLSESPSVDWGVLDGGETTESTPVPAKRPNQNQTRIGPFDHVESNAPTTLGEFLLSVQREPPSRGVLIFVPKIAAESK